MKKRSLFSLLFAGLVLSVQPSAAADPDPRALLEKSQSGGTPKTMQSTMVMVLQDSGGRNQGRLLEIRKAGDKQLVWFVKPADLAGTAFLRLGDAKNRKMWLYLPGFKKLERISGAKENEGFLGSDFTYADMSDRNLDAFKHQYAGKEKLGSTAVHKVISTLAAEDEDALYGKIISYLDAATGQLLQEDLYDQAGDLVKRKTHEGFKKVDAYTLPSVIVMKSVESNHVTRLEMKNIVVDKPIADSMFSTEEMKRIRP